MFSHSTHSIMVLPLSHMQKVAGPFCSSVIKYTAITKSTVAVYCEYAKVWHWRSCLLELLKILELNKVARYVTECFYSIFNV